MMDKVFRLLDAINRSGIDNGQWGVKEDVPDTRAQFGTTKVYRLEGKWLFVYTDNDGHDPIADWSPDVNPDMVERIFDEDEKNVRIMFYKLED